MTQSLNSAKIWIRDGREKRCWDPPGNLRWEKLRWGTIFQGLDTFRLKWAGFGFSTLQPSSIFLVKQYSKFPWMKDSLLFSVMKFGWGLPYMQHHGWTLSVLSPSICDLTLTTGINDPVLAKQLMIMYRYKAFDVRNICIHERRASGYWGAGR